MLTLARRLMAKPAYAVENVPTRLVGFPHIARFRKKHKKPKITADKNLMTTSEPRLKGKGIHAAGIPTR